MVYPFSIIGAGASPTPGHLVPQQIDLHSCLFFALSLAPKIEASAHQRHHDNEKFAFLLKLFDKNITAVHGHIFFKLLYVEDKYLFNFICLNQTCTGRNVVAPLIHL